VCTLVIINRVFASFPLVVASNRDEQLDRPSGPPRIWTDRPISVFAPVDRIGGGSWLGINARGVFVGITNRVGSSPPDKNRRSRGLLVLEALEEKDAQSAAERIGAIVPKKYNRFHLIVADKQQAFLIWSDGEQVTYRNLGVGVHILTERSLGAASGQREEWIGSRLKAVDPKVCLRKDFWSQLLGYHAKDPFDGTCVHAPKFDYATRSSSLIWMESDSVRFFHAEGAPCKTPYVDFSKQVTKMVTQSSVY